MGRDEAVNNATEQDEVKQAIANKTRQAKPSQAKPSQANAGLVEGEELEQ